MKKYSPKYSGPNRSGICICGHSWEDHHLGMVMNPEYYAQTNESYFPEECEFYGSNESGGLDDAGAEHCRRYVDKLDLESQND